MVILLLTAAIITVYLIRAQSKIAEKPTIKIDYVAQYKEMSQPDNYDEKDNAAKLYQDAFDCFTQMSQQSQNIFPEGYLSKPQWPAQLDPQTYKTLTQWLDSNKQALEYASEAAKKPYYWIPPTSKDNIAMAITIPNLRKFKYLARAMTLQAIVDAKQGRYELAFDRLRRTYLTGKHLSGNRSLIEQLVSMGIISNTFGGAKLILTEADVPTEQIASFQKFLEDHAEEIEPLDFSLESLTPLDLVQRFFTDDGEGNGHLILSDFCEFYYSTVSPSNRQTSIAKYGLKRALEKKLDKIAENARLYKKCARHDDRKTTLEKIDTLYAFLDKMVQQTPWQMHSRQINCEQQVLEIVKPDENVFIATFLFATQGLNEIHHQHICKHHALMTTMAINRYKAEHGRFPPALDCLIDTGYIKAIPMDPFSNGPLIYRTIGNDFILYSFGRNFEDDGGKHKEQSDKKNYDIVFWPIYKLDKQSQTGTEPQMLVR